MELLELNPIALVLAAIGIIFLIVYGLKEFQEAVQESNETDTLTEEKLDAKKKWTKYEIIIAAYIKIFGLKDNIPFVDSIAKEIGRTPSSLSRRIRAMGTTDMSLLDRDVWEEMKGMTRYQGNVEIRKALVRMGCEIRFLNKFI